MSESFRTTVAKAGMFHGYAYAYPHKTTYRKLAPPRPLAQVWSDEDKSALFLYAHIPFCEMRCGFCNLFTMTRPGQNLVAAYLDALSRQAESVSKALGSAARVSRMALGGGTPTFLSVEELQRLFGILKAFFPSSANGVPKAIEASPATVNEEKIALLRAQKINRASLGVQSFVESEARALGRSQRTNEVRQALGMLTAAGFDCVNVDLIYGIAGQTPQTWKRSLEEAMEFAPEEMYLYPLYIRPLTLLGKTRTDLPDVRPVLYRIGRDLLLSNGYRQISMRLFRKESYNPAEGPVYCCQEDGMVGLGPGARSYTRALHYSSDYAVTRGAVLGVIEEFIYHTGEQFSFADYGCELNLEEQRRRYVLKSLLRTDGLDLTDYFSFFQSEIFADIPQLKELLFEGLAVNTQGQLKLTSDGLALSDAIGPWLWSSAVREKMNTFETR